MLFILLNHILHISYYSGDGIDCLKKRKSKVMPNNVLGYNRTSTSYRGKIHDIHLRLRRPGSHELIDYESIAATMCHELAHCVRGPHDAHFYKVNILFSCNLAEHSFTI